MEEEWCVREWSQIECAIVSGCTDAASAMASWQGTQIENRTSDVGQPGESCSRSVLTYLGIIVSRLPKCILW